MWPPKDRNDWLALFFSGVAAAAVIAGFVTIGSPGRARAERIDEQRMAAVQSTATALNCYHRTVQPLGRDLASVGAAIEANAAQLQSAPGCWNAAWRKDPQTGEAFALSWFGPNKVRLCAQFSRTARAPEDTPAFMPGGVQLAVAEGPRDASGRQCFTVDLKRVLE